MVFLQSKIYVSIHQSFTKSISLSEVVNPRMSKITTLGTNPTEFQNMESVLLDFQSQW